MQYHFLKRKSCNRFIFTFVFINAFSIRASIRNKSPPFAIRRLSFCHRPAEFMSTFSAIQNVPEHLFHRIIPKWSALLDLTVSLQPFSYTTKDFFRNKRFMDMFCHDRFSYMLTWLRKISYVNDITQQIPDSFSPPLPQFLPLLLVNSFVCFVIARAVNLLLIQPLYNRNNVSPGIITHKNLSNDLTGQRFPHQRPSPIHFFDSKTIRRNTA